MMMKAIIEKNSEELFLLLLKMTCNELQCTTDNLLTLDAALKLLTYLNDKIEGNHSDIDEDTVIETKTLRSNDELQNKINLIYNRLLRLVKSYEGTRH